MGSSRDGCLWLAAVVAVVLLALVAIGWSMAMDRRAKLVVAQGELAEAQKQIDGLVKNLSDARAGLEEGKADVLERDAGLEEERLRAAALQEKFQDMEGLLGDRESSIAALETRVQGLSETVARLTADLKSMTEKHATARKAASGKAGLLDKIDAANAKIAELESGLAEQHKAAAVVEAAKKEIEAELQKATADIDEREVSLKKLREELAEIPVMPLPDELAKAKYHEYLNEVAEYSDRENRVNRLFRAKLALAGSSYEGKVDSAWRKEMRKKKDDADRTAKAVYGEVSSKVRLHRDAHDQNIALYTEALEKVRGTKYEKVLQQLIDREHELKAAGR
jgi:peptidoglycan hydrolase CwlO-like protein